MDLPSKLIRDSIGIDTFERAIVFSALLLRSGYFANIDNTVKNAVQIALNLNNTADGFVSNIIIRATLEVSNISLNDGGNILLNLLERQEGTVNYTGENLAPSLSGLPITDDLPEVLTLEQYFFWVCQMLLENDIEGKYKTVVISPVFRGTTDPFTIDCSALIPFDYQTYLNGNNLIGAVTAVLGDSSIIGNETLLSNDYQLRN